MPSSTRNTTQWLPGLHRYSQPAHLETAAQALPEAVVSAVCKVLDGFERELPAKTGMIGIPGSVHRCRRAFGHLSEDQRARFLERAEWRLIASCLLPRDARAAPRDPDAGNDVDSNGSAVNDPGVRRDRHHASGCLRQTTIGIAAIGYLVSILIWVGVGAAFGSFFGG